MGSYFRVVADSRDLNYDKFLVNGDVKTMADEAYTSHNTNRLNKDEVIQKLLTTEYVKKSDFIFHLAEEFVKIEKRIMRDLRRKH